MLAAIGELFNSGVTPSQPSAASTSASPPPAPVATAPQLELESWSWHFESDYAIAEGAVKNVSNQPLKVVEVVVSFNDRKGGFITSDDALIKYNPILPGQTSPFEAMAPENPAMQQASIDFKALFGGSIPWKQRAKKK